MIMVGLWYYNLSGVTELLIMRDSYHVGMCFKDSYNCKTGMRGSPTVAYIEYIAVGIQ